MVATSCSDNSVVGPDLDSEVGNISLRAAIEDPFALAYTNLAYVYIQKSAPLNTTVSVTTGARSKDGSINNFSVNGEQIPAKGEQEFISTDFNEDVNLPADGNFSMVMNKTVNTLSQMDIKLIETENRIIQAGTQFNWAVSNYSGPTWFGIVENPAQSGSVLPNVNYHYESVSGNSITVTDEMLESFTNGRQVTVYLGIGNYVSSKKDLFILGCSINSSVYTVSK